MTLETIIANIERNSYRELTLTKEFVRICEVVRNYFQVEESLFYNAEKTRKRDVVDARAVAIFFGHKHYESFGLFGWSRMASVLNMDHASMIHNNTKINSLLKYDRPIQLVVTRIAELLNKEVEVENA